MNSKRTVLAFSLLLALVAAGCGLTPAQQPPDRPPAVVQPTDMPTSAPTAAVTAVATMVPTVAPTAVPTEVPAATPTSVPPEATTAIPVATAQPKPALLPLASVWIGMPEGLLAQADGLELFRPQEHGLPEPAYNWTAAATGAAVAYDYQNGGVAVVDMISGEHFNLAETGTTIVGESFSPDAHMLAYTEIAQERWQLKVRDRASRATRVLHEGDVFPTQGSQIEGVLAPLAWTHNGLLAQRLIWGSDAPPFKLSLVDPVDGRVQVLRDEGYIAAYPAQDGTKIALVTGQIILGDGPSELGLSVFDLATGEREIVPKGRGWIGPVRWSPDGRQLLYHVTPDAPATTLIMVNADGSNERWIDLGAGVEGAGRNARFMDAAWTQQSGPVLLIADERQQLRLFALSEAAFETHFGVETAREIALYGPVPDDRVRIPIVYMP